MARLILAAVLAAVLAAPAMAGIKVDKAGAIAAEAAPPPAQDVDMRLATIDKRFRTVCANETTRGAVPQSTCVDQQWSRFIAIECDTKFPHEADRGKARACHRERMNEIMARRPSWR